jgi:hypothetical protein
MKRREVLDRVGICLDKLDKILRTMSPMRQKPLEPASDGRWDIVARSTAEPQEWLEVHFVPEYELADGAVRRRDTFVANGTAVVLGTSPDETWRMSRDGCVAYSTHSTWKRLLQAHFPVVLCELIGAFDDWSQPELRLQPGPCPAQVEFEGMTLKEHVRKEIVALLPTGPHSFEIRPDTGEKCPMLATDVDFAIGALQFDRPFWTVDNHYCALARGVLVARLVGMRVHFARPPNGPRVWSSG